MKPGPRIDIAVARPPFPWPGVHEAGRVHDAAIRAATARLLAVRAYASGPPAGWQPENISWLAALLANAANAALPDIALDDRQSGRRHDAFADWLAHAAIAGHPAPMVRAGMAAFEPVLRRAPVFSFRDKGVPDLQYYRHGVMAAQLAEIAAAPRNAGGAAPLLVAIGMYAHFIAVHPFMDGNGRAARRFLLNVLRGYRLWGDDPLPLAFLLYRDRARYIDGARKLVAGRDWSSFVPYMASLLSAAAELSVLVRHCHPCETARAV